MGGTITTSDGLRLVADRGARADFMLELPREEPARALDAVLADIAARYGQGMSDMVRLQLEDAGHTTGR